MRIFETNDLESFRKKVDLLGASFSLNAFDIREVDTVISKLDSLGTKSVSDDVIMFCDPRLLRSIVASLSKLEESGMSTVGTYDVNDMPNVFPFVFEKHISRGGYQIFFCGKVMNGGLVVPVFEGESDKLLEQYSINLKWR